MLNAIVTACRGPPSVISYAIAWMCALYGLAVWAQPRRVAVGAAAIALAMLVSGAGPTATVHDGLIWGLATLVGQLIVRRVVGDREQRAQAAERELAAREAIIEERARIARELHDVVAHNVRMIVVQAGAERRVLDDANASTREVLETIEQIGRSALTEMRRLLGMLRGDLPQAPTATCGSSSSRATGLGASPRWAR